MKQVGVRAVYAHLLLAILYWTTGRSPFDLDGEMILVLLFPFPPKPQRG